MDRPYTLEERWTPRERTCWSDKRVEMRKKTKANLKWIAVNIWQSENLTSEVAIEIAKNQQTMEIETIW